MKIQAGKRYVRRDGKISGVITKDRNKEYPFLDYTNGRSYNENGLWFNGTEHDEDLIREYVEPQPAETEPEPETLRDRFAMAALQGILTASMGNGWHDKSYLPKLSYEYADAMMEARKQ